MTDSFNPERITIASGPRQSNFELLRIIAMFMVMCVHANFTLLPDPTVADLKANPADALTRTLIEGLVMVCDNLFILISGWFGIRPSKRSFLNLVWQILYFSCGLYICGIISGRAHFSWATVEGIFMLNSSYWFLKCYILLYIFAPILNQFVEHASRRTFRNLLVAFFVFQTFYGYDNAAVCIVRGYSVVSFIGVYLLARYMRIYGVGEAFKRAGAWIYVGCALLMSVQHFVFQYFGIELYTFISVNPLMILGAVGLMLRFSVMKPWHSRLLNGISASCLAVYLFHTHPYVQVPVYDKILMHVYNSTSGITTLLLFGAVLAAFYLLAILLDQPRKWLFRHIAG